MKRMLVLVGVLTLVFLVVGPAMAQKAASLAVLSPKEGETIKGPVVVRLEVKNFRVVDFTKETAVRENAGHIHIQLDEQPFNTIHTASPVFVYGGVKPGAHTITVELVHSDHTPLKEKVMKKVSFQVQ